MSSAEYKLNTRFLGRLILVVIVLAVGIYFFHGYQEGRLINRYLTQADQARDAGDHIKETEYLKQYYALNPENTDALVRFGMVATRHGTPGLVQEGFYALQKALRSNPNLDKEVRLQCVKIALQPGMDAAMEAKRNLEELFKTTPMDKDTEMLYVQSLVRTGNEPMAEKIVAEIVARDKTRIDAFAMLAVLKKRANRSDPKPADDVIQAMLNYPSNVNNHLAWLRAALFYRLFGPTEPLQERVQHSAKRYEEAIGKAIELAPDDPEVIYHAAEHQLTVWLANTPLNSRPVPTPEFDRALEHLNRGLALLGPLQVPDPLPEYASKERARLELHLEYLRTMSSSLIMVERYVEAERYAREMADKFPDYLILHTELLKCLVRQQKYPEAEALCNRMAQRNFMPSFVELQRGYMKFQQRKFSEAARHLERTVSELAMMPDEKRLASQRLAICYEETGEIDRAIEALKISVPTNNLDPMWVPTSLALAERMAQLGRLQEAITVYKEVDERGDKRALAPLINLMIRLRTLSPNASVDAELDRLMKKMPEGPVKDHLIAEYAQSNKEFDKARSQLDQALARDPKNPNLAMSRFTIELREKKYDDARKLVAETEARHGNSFVVRQMKAALLIDEFKGDASIAPQLEELARGMDAFSPAERLFMFKQLSLGARAIQRRDLARTFLERAVAERGDQDLELQHMLLDLALLDNDEPRILKVLDDIARISGGKDNHSYKLPQSFYLIHKAQSITDPRSQERRRLLEQASDILRGLEATRKEWGRLYLAQGKVADMLGDRSTAISKMIKAVEHGERYPEVFTRLTQLCNLEGRKDVIKLLDATYPEARAMLAGNPEELIEAMINSGDQAGAIDRLREAIPESLDDARKQAYAANVYSRCGKLTDAETRIRRAHTLDPMNAEIWLAYVQTLVQNNKAPEARTLIEANQHRFTTSDATLAVAMAHMAVDDLEKSRPIFESLMATRGTEIPVLRAAGSFYFNKERDSNKTISVMEKILKHPQATPQDKEIARRTLARCIIATRDHRSGLRALDMLGFKSPSEAARFSGSESIDELRARFAVLFVIKGRAAREASVAVLREIERKSNELSIDEQLAFGQLMYALGNWTEARRRLLVAANLPENNPTAIAIYANALLRMGELEDARKQIDRVVAIDPDSQSAVELQARLAMLNDRPNEAVEVLRKHARGRNGKPHAVAAILVNLGLEAEAESLYCEAAESDSRPEIKILYAHYLGRQGRTSESIDEFRKHWNNVRPDIVCQLLCDAMSNADPAASSSAIAEAGEYIAAAAAKSTNIRALNAAFKSVTGKVPEAIELSREVLRNNPQDMVTQNNLAFLISYHDSKHDEALTMIRKAIEAVGPIPTLMDTEAMILMASGKANDAVERLQEVVVDEPGAVAYLHLAQAYVATGRIADAKVALQNARKYNLRINDFHPLERQAVRNTIALLDR